MSLYRLARWFHTIGADVDIDKNKAFLYVCDSGDLAMAQWLHKLGADIHTENDAAFRLVCKYNKPKIANPNHIMVLTKSSYLYY